MESLPLTWYAHCLTLYTSHYWSLNYLVSFFLGFLPAPIPHLHLESKKDTVLSLLSPLPLAYCTW